MLPSAMSTEVNEAHVWLSLAADQLIGVVVARPRQLPPPAIGLSFAIVAGRQVEIRHYA